MQRFNVLILGGTTESSALTRALKDDTRFAPVLSLAGRTRTPAEAPVPCRVGGFGGADGLASYLETNRIDALIDATHPFAVHISENAAIAAKLSTVPLFAICRPPWQPVAGDRWIDVADLSAAAARLGPRPQRVFLTVGRKELAPFRAQPHHAYVIRSVDAPPPELLPPEAEVITARGPFNEASELRLLKERAIDIVVTKNSGGTATEAKLAAARALHLPVIMVERPARKTNVEMGTDATAALRWLAARHDAVSRSARGV